jgi:predicted membrane channel-forming protein YqfA (hemolysin III family)
MLLQVLADYRTGDKRALVHFVGLSPLLFPFVPHSCVLGYIHGILLKLLWMDAPRWLSVVLYLGMG